MSASAARNRATTSELVPNKVETGLGETPLYFKNNGLFSDTYLLHHLPDTANNKFILEHWETEPLPQFTEAYEWMLSTWSELKDILPTLNEAQLEERWVRPILKKLGWEIEVQDRLKKRGKTQIPDYSLFDSLETYKKAKGCKTDDAYFRHVLAVADAKAMGIPLDGSARSNSNPTYQIIRYLEDTGKSWGILTDGLYWRLYSLRSQSKYADYYEVNLAKLLSKRDDSRFKYFFNFFRKESFVPNTVSGQSFLDVTFEGGEQYAKEVETRLKGRAFRMVEMLCRGFSKGKPDLDSSELKAVYDHSLYYLFRLMFVLNCEARGLLEVGKQSDYFVYSLRALCIKLKEEFEQSRPWSDQPRTYNYIADLFELLRKGDEKIGIHGFGNEMFSSGQPDFFEKRRIPDSILNYVLIELALSYDDSGSLKFIDYKRLSHDHLGSLFEGLLEFKPAYATKKLARINDEVKDWSGLPPKKQNQLKDSIIEKGNLYLDNTDGDRKKTGSYYTPLSIVDNIARTTIAPLTASMSVDEMFKIRCVDPAMGSGPFLLGVISVLEEQILEKLYAKGDKISEIDPQQIRWKILHSCIFGMDLNPLAIELAKFSLWMFTARRGHCLEPLGDQLPCGNSLHYETWKSNFAGTFRSNGGFDVVVGNPPYVRIQGMEEREVKNLRQGFETAGQGNFDVYVAFVERALSILSTKGRLGFILPHKFLNADYGAPLRALISRNRHLERLVHFADLQIFPSATTYTCLLFLSKEPQKTFSIVKVTSVEEFLEVKENGEIFDSSSISEAPWSFADKSARNLIQELQKQQCVVGNYVEKIFVGLQTSADKVYIVRLVKKTKQGVVVESRELGGKEILIEDDILHPVLRGADVARYDKPEHSFLVIFPYRVTKGEVVPYSLSEMKSSFPKALAYLSSVKERLAERDKASASNWWLYARPQNLALFCQPKIVFQVLSKSGKFFHDSGGEYHFLGGGTAGGNALLLKDGTDRKISKILLAVLNSRITMFYIAQVGSAFRGGFFAFSRTCLSNMPIPEIDPNSKVSKEIVSLVEKRENAKGPTKEKLEEEINHAICELYSLTPSQRRWLEDHFSQVPSPESESDITK